MKNPFETISRKKRTAEAALQRFGRRLRDNIDQGQKDLRTKKIQKYQAINPFK